MWKGRFPHWRADHVEYYFSFPHRQALSEDECLLLFSHLMRAHGKAVTYLALVVVPEKTEALCTVREASDGEPFDFADVVSKAQRRFLKKTGATTNRTFYAEPFDRIVRDESEREAFLMGIMNGPDTSPTIEDSDHWLAIFIDADQSDDEPESSLA